MYNFNRCNLICSQQIVNVSYVTSKNGKLSSDLTLLSSTVGLLRFLTVTIKSKGQINPYS